MTHTLSFRATAPAQAARDFGSDAIHLWRLPYQPAQGREPLLQLLGAYLGVPASAVVLRENAHGKPALVESGRLEFNWSHSGEHALVALARDVEPGVDIERVRARPRILDIARRFFDPGEVDALAALDEDMRPRAFVALWCAKEAVLKAVGAGLSFGLARLAFTLHEGQEWRLARPDPELGKSSDWRLHAFRTCDDCLAALAWRGGPREVLAFGPQT
jgi:4'-phosphopantetheinyl transferase